MSLDHTLRLYDGKSGGGGVLARSVPLDPERCPVMRIEAGRITHYSQCSRRPKPKTFRPVFDYRTARALKLEVCGIHAGVYDRAEKKLGDARRLKEVRTDERAQMDQLADDISSRLGFTVEVEERPVKYGSLDYRVTGKVRVDAARLLDALKGA